MTGTAHGLERRDEGDNLFLHEGDFWTIAYHGRSLRLGHRKGLVYIAKLLGEPGRRVPSVELVAGSAGPEAPPTAAERARINVTRAIRTALGRIAAKDPKLGSHLADAIVTGASCCYAPTCAVPERWVVRPLAG